MNTYKCDNCGCEVTVTDNDDGGAIETASIHVVGDSGVADWKMMPHSLVCNINERQRDGH